MAVHKVSGCGVSCISDPSCFSFNIAIRSDFHGLFLCELLATDKYNASRNVKASGDYHHYSFKVSDNIRV